jgi:hypothetical protein
MGITQSTDCSRYRYPCIPNLLIEHLSRKGHLYALSARTASGCQCGRLDVTPSPNPLACLWVSKTIPARSADRGLGAIRASPPCLLNILSGRYIYKHLQGAWLRDADVVVFTTAWLLVGYPGTGYLVNPDGLNMKYKSWPWCDLRILSLHVECLSRKVHLSTLSARTGSGCRCIVASSRPPLRSVLGRLQERLLEFSHILDCYRLLDVVLDFPASLPCVLNILP